MKLVARLHNTCIYSVACQITPFTQSCIMSSEILAPPYRSGHPAGHPKLMQLETRLLGCQKLQMTAWPVWQRTLYSCIHMAAVGINGPMSGKWYVSNKLYAVSLTCGRSELRTCILFKLRYRVFIKDFALQTSETAEHPWFLGGSGSCPFPSVSSPPIPSILPSFPSFHRFPFVFPFRSFSFPEEFDRGHKPPKPLSYRPIHLLIYMYEHYCA